MLRQEFMSGEAAIPLAPALPEQRTEPRRDCEGMPALLFLGRATYGAKVGNISESGAMIKATAKPLVDTGDANPAGDDDGHSTGR